MKKIVKSNGALKEKCFPKSFWVIGLISFCFFLVLTYLFPYTGDDWAWGTKIGMERLSTFFWGYNGRYAGNLLVLLLTRSNIVKTLTMSAASVGLCFLACRYCDAKKSYFLILSVVLYLLMPKRIFAQAFVWTSGFANYIPPAVLSFAFICLVKRDFENDRERCSAAESVFCFLFSFFGGLFMENITLYNIFLAGMVLLLSICKFKKVFPSHVSFAAGALLSCVLMLMNPAYLSIFGGNDDYRSLSDQSGGILVTVVEHLKETFKYLIIDNYILCALIGIVLILLAIKKFGRLRPICKTGTVLFGTALLLSSIFLIVNAVRCYPAIQNKIAVAYVVSVFALTVCITEKENMIKVLTPVVSSAVLVAPLLVINPIGPRCFFFPYFLMVVFLLQVLSDLCCDKTSVNVGLTVISAVSFILIAANLLPIFLDIHRVDTERSRYARQRSDANAQVCEVCSLPHHEYLHCAEVNAEPWNTRYKLFYGLDENMEFRYVSREGFEKAANSRP